MYRVGVDLGGTNIAIGLYSDDGMKLIAKKSVPTRSEGDNADIIATKIAETALEVIKESGFSESEIRSIGVGVPGLIDREKNEIVRTPNLPFSHYDLGGLFKKFTNIPLKVENDANCAALGENVAGAAAGKKSVIVVTLGTGVGGGIVIDGKIFSGFNFCGAELGHMVVHKNGIQCGCGRKGCFEQYASATALINMTKEAFAKNPKSKIGLFCDGDAQKINGKTVFDAKDAGDETATAVVDNYIDELSEGLANFVNIFQPEVILISGGICNQKEKLLVPLKKAVDSRSFGEGLIKLPELKIATLGNEAGVLGAAML